MLEVKCSKLKLKILLESPYLLRQFRLIIQSDQKDTHNIQFFVFNVTRISFLLENNDFCEYEDMCVHFTHSVYPVRNKNRNKN